MNQQKLVLAPCWRGTPQESACSPVQPVFLLFVAGLDGISSPLTVTLPTAIAAVNPLLPVELLTVARLVLLLLHVEVAVRLNLPPVFQVAVSEA